MDHLAIPALQRATLICDVADLARNGYVSQVMLIICGKSSSLTSILGEVDMFETSPSIHIISRGNQHIWQNYCFILRRLWPWCWDTGSLKKSLDPCWLSKSVSTQMSRMIMKRILPFNIVSSVQWSRKQRNAYLAILKVSHWGLLRMAKNLLKSENQS